MTIQFNTVTDGYASGAKVTLDPVKEAAYVAATVAAYAVADPVPGGFVLPVRGPLTNTALTTVGNGTLTAAALTGAVITRTGPTGAYTDTTDTATNILAALPQQQRQIGVSFDLTIVNTVAFANTVAAGSGVTLAGTTAIAASTWRRYIGTITAISTPAVTLTGIASGTL